uniref:Uncharacterized protein n=1 Tax=Timema poppense TaxID=170557 RepID=A0A7R9CZV7_TIMPO|nr:unnamed protein product [Timema poppensis]
MSDVFQREGNCSCIQSVAALDIDPIGRLWVLDEGGRCPPKLVVLDLWRDKEVTRCDLPSIEGREMRSLAVDTLSGWGARAYIGDPGGNRLMIFSIRDQRYWFSRLQLRQHMECSLVSDPPGGSYVTDRPAPMASREFHNPIDEINTAVPTEFIETDNPTVQCFNQVDNIEQTKMGPSTLNGILTDGNPPEIVSTEVSSFDLALSRKDPTLYLTSRKSELLFSVDLTHLRANLAPNVGQEAILDVQYLGRKLGLSVGLTTDYKGGLHYFLPRDNVAVRWDTQIPLAAESHTITLQSAELLPSVSQLFVDQQRQVWAVTNHNGASSSGGSRAVAPVGTPSTPFNLALCIPLHRMSFRSQLLTVQTFGPTDQFSHPCHHQLPLLYWLTNRKAGVYSAQHIELLDQQIEYLKANFSEAKKQSSYIVEKLHGITWDSGDVDYSMLKFIILCASKNAERVNTQSRAGETFPISGPLKALQYFNLSSGSLAACHVDLSGHLLNTFRTTCKFPSNLDVDGRPLLPTSATDPVLIRFTWQFLMDLRSNKARGP